MNFENGSNCSTMSQGQFAMTPIQTKLVVSVYLCLTLTIILGNASVIWAYIKCPNIRDIPFNIFVLNIAFTDLCVGIFNVPFHALTILYPGLEYKNRYASLMILYIGYVNALTSIFTIAVMCYDHLVLISNPTTYQQNRTKGANRRIVVALWPLSCIYCLCMVLLRTFLRKGDNSCESNIPHVIVMLIGNVFIPFFGVLSLKCVIVVKLQIHFLQMSKMFGMNTKRKRGETRSQGESKSVSESRTESSGDERRLHQTGQFSSSDGQIHVLSNSRPENLRPKEVTMENGEEHVREGQLYPLGKDVEAVNVPQDTRPFNFGGRSIPTLKNISCDRKKMKMAWKAASQVVIFALVYLICWSPTHVYFFIKEIRGVRLYDAMDIWQNVYYVILYFNAALNPLLYAWMSQTFAKGMKAIFCRK